VGTIGTIVIGVVFVGLGLFRVIFVRAVGVFVEQIVENVGGKLFAEA